MRRIIRGLIFTLVLVLAGTGKHGARALAGLDSETMPVPGGTAALLRVAGIQAGVEPSRAVLVLARTLHGNVPLPGLARDSAAVASSLVETIGYGAGASEDVPALLPREIWEQAVFGRAVEPSRLALEILRDPRAALLYCGLFSLDAETLAYFAAQPALVAQIYSNAAGRFAAFGESITVRGGAVVLPGGEAHASQWEHLVGKRAAEPYRFIPALLGQDDGRLAWLVDVVSSLDPARQRFAIRDGVEPLYARFAGETLPFDFAQRPFSRPSIDLGFVLRTVGVTDGGSLAPPSDLSLWELVFTGNGRSAPKAELTAPWLLHSLAALPSAERRRRLEAVLFAQRVFPGSVATRGTEGASALALALSAYPSHSALMLTLERLGFTNPQTYMAAIRAASVLTTGADTLHASLRLAMFQGALALVVRLRDVDTIDDRTARSLASSLFELPGSDAAGLSERLGSWIDTALLRVLPGDASGDADERLLDGLAGIAPARAHPIVTWEDQKYRVDVAWGERARLRRIRQRQRGNDLSSVLEVRRRKARGLDVTPELSRLVTKIDLPDNSSLFQSGESGGAENARPAGSTTAAKAGRVAKPAAPVNKLAEWQELVLGQLLASFAYAIAIGDPDSTMLLAGDPANMHDFGINLRGRSTSWLVATDARAGSQSISRGSILGLDRALAVPSLRQITLAAPTVAPSLGQMDLQGLAEGIATLNPFRLDDRDRDAIAADLQRGRERVRTAARNPDEIDALAAATGVERWRRRLMRIAASADAESVMSYWSLEEVRGVGRGGPTPASLNAWGPAQRLVDGSWRTALPARLAMHELEGRGRDGLLSGQIADLHLRIAEWLAEAKLPAALAPGILRSALWDLAMHTRMAHPDDWLAVVRMAQSVSADRMADYASALTADGPLVPVPSEKRER